MGTGSSAQLFGADLRMTDFTSLSVTGSKVRKGKPLKGVLSGSGLELVSESSWYRIVLILSEKKLQKMSGREEKGYRVGSGVDLDLARRLFVIL